MCTAARCTLSCTPGPKVGQVGVVKGTFSPGERMLTAEMGCTMGCMISGPIATMTADGADGDAESDITVPIVASVTCSWLPPVALPSIDMREPRER